MALARVGHTEVIRILATVIDDLVKGVCVCVCVCVRARVCVFYMLCASLHLLVFNYFVCVIATYTMYVCTVNLFV